MSAFRPDGWTTPELAQAVERGQLELHYQPVVDLRSGGGCLRKRKKAYAKLTIEESYYPKRYPESKRPRQVNISHQCDNLSHSKLMDLRG